MVFPYRYNELIFKLINRMRSRMKPKEIKEESSEYYILDDFLNWKVIIFIFLILFLISTLI
jgi:hypothetical protein